MWRAGRNSLIIGVGAVAGSWVAGCDSGSSTPSDASQAGTAGVSALGGSATAGGAAGGTVAGASASGTANGGTGLAGDAGSPGSAGSPQGGAGAGGAPDGSEGGMLGGGGDETAGAGHAGAAGEGTEPTGGSGEGGGGPICERVVLTTEPRPSNVVFMVDRSGTMFDSNEEPWTALRSAALPLIDAYDATLRIGFLAMTAEAASCPQLDEVAPALGSHSAIKAKYESLGKPTKGESPFMLALTRAGELLNAAPQAEKFAIFVIDGEPDYCNDGNALCAIDSTVARIQALRDAGITTLVAGLPTQSPIGEAQYTAALQSYANAGAGLPVASVGASAANLYFQCNVGDPPAPSWPAEFTASGKPAMQALGSYSANAGAASVVLFDPGDAADLSSELDKLFSRTKSCRVGLSKDVQLDAAASGHVTLMGAELVHGDDWTLSATNELTLVGEACAAWQVPNPGTLSADFPCAVVSEGGAP